MSLIDETILNEDNKKKECKKCGKELISTSPILLCETHFNEEVFETLKRIKLNIEVIKVEIKKIKHNLDLIFKESTKDHPGFNKIVIKNKIEIDKRNFEALLKKFEIDLELNEWAFAANQRQSNELRKSFGWKEIKPISIHELNDK